MPGGGARRATTSGIGPVAVGGGLLSEPFLGVGQAVTLAVGFQDVDPVGKPVEHGTGQL